MKKRLLSLTLTLVLCLSLMPSAFAMTGVKITQKGQVVDSITFNGVTVNAIYAPQATVSNYSTDTTYSCAAFVSKFYKQVYGITVNNLVKNGGGPKASKGSFSKTTSPKVGDVVHRKTSTSTHWAIVKAVSGNTITLIEQNAWYSKADDKARVGKTYDLSDSAVTVYRYSEAGGGSETTTTSKMKSYSLTYKWNGGTWGPMSSAGISDGGSYTFTINTQEATRDGYTFLGWSKDQNATSPSYRPGDSITVYGDVDLYAIWKKNCDNGHTWGEWKVTTQAACNVSGQRQRTCSVCGKSENETIPALEHNYQVQQDTALYTRYLCANCGDTYTVEKEPDCSNGHDYQVQQSTNAYTLYVCTQCGETYIEDKEILPSVSGNMNNFKTTAIFYSGIFQDVTENKWFYNNVSTVCRLGLMKGTGDGVFSPDNNMTLGEAVTLAARIHSTYYANGETFTSYDGGNWYDPYVDYARKNGIVNTYYNYSRPATREEFVHILARALPENELSGTAGSISFADSADITYMSDVRLLSGAGVINGIQEYGDTYFRPLAPITRAQVAAVISRMVQPATRVSR